MDNDIINYLVSYKDTNSIDTILELIIKKYGFSGYDLFLYNTINYENVLEKKGIIIKNIFDTYIQNKINVNEYYENSETKINNIIYIPILISSNIKKYLLVLYNKNENIKEELLNELLPYINILKIYLINYVKDDRTGSELFLINMSHEIRTPLNGIIGYLHLLTNTQLTKIQQTYIHNINNCSVQLLQIINDILDYTRLSVGNIKLTNECFSITELMDIVKETIHQKLIEKKQILNIEIDSKVPIYILLDKQKLIQIMINIITNANKFSPLNKTIYLKLFVDDIYLYIEIRDEGIGINKNDYETIFNSFSQLDKKEYNTGIGLGLSICKKLCILLGGDIKVDSEIGKGSTFTIKVKYMKEEQGEKLIDIDKKILKGKYILVVDDNQDNRLFLSELLFGWNMIPIICASSIEALSIIKRYKFELGLIDICMPDMSGKELAIRIKDEYPLFQLIALSSVDKFSYSNEFEFKLDKPICKTQLFRCIYNIICNNTDVVQEMSIKENANNNISCSPTSTFNKNIRILVAEDILYNQTLIVNILETLGYFDIDVAENGKQAIELIKKAEEDVKQYDLLILDLRMPVYDGYMVIKHIRENKYELPKIIVNTASIDKNDKKKCYHYDIQFFLNKPIDIKKLQRTILLATQYSHK